MLSFILFLNLHFIPSSVWAEYRVFNLIISRGTSQRTLASTLDPLQYPGYFPLQAGEKVEYVETWMCLGRTENFKDLCPNPQKAQIQPPPNPEITTP